VRYLADRRGEHFHKIALADSSQVALTMAGKILPPGVDRYQIDLMNLGWEDEWDIAFMLDVIEHIPDDIRAVRQAAKALKPGGLLLWPHPRFSSSGAITTILRTICAVIREAILRRLPSKRA